MGNRYIITKKVLALLVMVVMLTQVFAASVFADTEKTIPSVVISDEGTHYEVVADICGLSDRRLFGVQYGIAIKAALPQYERLLDTYLLKMSQFFATAYNMSTNAFYNKMLSNAKSVFPQIDKAYQDEILGLASQFSPTASNVSGDGKISRDEMVAFNLVADSVRLYECSAAAVFGERSEIGSTIAARNLDWVDLGIASKLNCVLTIKNGTKSICLIGFLGNLGAMSAFNKSGVFAAVLDTSMTNMKPAQAAGKRSYYMDLRHAVENETTLQNVANYMKDPNKNYIYNHLIFIADRNSSGVLENNFSGTGTNMNRALRTWYSQLNPGITWGIPNAIGCVNCFMLKGNHDDYTGVLQNTARWASLKRELLAKGNKVSEEELQSVISYSHKVGPGTREEGDLYFQESEMGCAQSMVFIPSTMQLKVFFRPRDSHLPDTRIFETIPVAF